MATEFRCEKCGKLLSVEAEPGSTTRCPHCKKRVVVPAVLASLPHPQMPGAHADAPPPPPPPGPAGDEPSEEEEEEEHPSDAVMGAMAHIMPWVISVFFHVGLALIMMFVAMIAVTKSMPEDVVVPNETYSETPGGSVNPGQDDPMQQAQQNIKQTQSMGESSSDQAVPSDDGKTDKPLRLIGSAAGGSRGGTLAAFGNRVGGSGAGPRSNFFGHGGNAHHICYVIDRSGSMVESFDRVRHEMLLSIGRLSPKQDFHVILFAKGAPQEASARKLVAAVPRYKEAAAEFLDSVRAAGQTDPIPALQRAFNVLSHANRMPGKLIYLLTDGDFPDNKAVLEDIRDKNAKKDVHINTYLYDYRGDQAVAVMKQIAKENGGRFKQISSDER